MIIPTPLIRPRRLRQHPILRQLISETTLSLQDLIFPLFIKGEKGEKQPIASMPGHFQIPLDQLTKEIDTLIELGIHTVILFGIPAYKDATGSDSYNDLGIIQRALRIIRAHTNKILVISDVCFCEYTDHGHCGVLSEKNGSCEMDNDLTLSILVKQAVSHAKAGANVIAPSGMIDGMVQALRHGLDLAGFQHIPILSYSVKYHSSLYGPFRFAAEGAPQSGDRSSHQMDPANVLEALREVKLDIEEGADMLMVKPAHAYLDIIQRIKCAYPTLPLGAYHTSGEFCMIKAAAMQGWVDEKRTAIEILTGIKRAGADFIITYYAKEFAHWIKD